MNHLGTRGVMRGWLGVCLAAVLVLAGCDAFEYHPYDARFSGAKHINATNIKRIQAQMAGRDSMRFAVITDTQRWYDETRRLVKHINARRDSLDFVVHLGDLTDFAVTREFVWMRDELQKLKLPYVCLIGNHDCLASGQSVFEEMYGEVDFSFQAGDTHFVCLNTNALEFDRSEFVPNLRFVKEDLDALDTLSTRRTVLCVHAAPGTDQFPSMGNAAYLHGLLRQFPSLQFALCGHEHTTKEGEPLGDGVMYYWCPAAESRRYFIFTLKQDGGYEYEELSY